VALNNRFPVIFVLIALAAGLGCRPDDKSAAVLPGDVQEKDGTVVPCSAETSGEPEECGAAIYHTRHIDEVKLGMKHQDVLVLMHVPTVIRGGGVPVSLVCYSVVLGRNELRCIEFKNDLVVGFSDRSRADVMQ
jgi:hypothetical protein